MSSFSRTLFIVAAVFALAGCIVTKGKETAAKGVERFHQQFNESRFPEMYAGGTAALKAAGPEAGFLKFMEAVRRKLGAFQSAKENGWKTKASVGQSVVTLMYNSQFERGAAVETFVFVVSGETATLQGYNINSPTLVID